MRRLAIILAGLVVFGATAQARPAGPAKGQPFVLMRTLQNVQERIAHGSPVALKLQNKLLVHMAREFSHMPMSVWALPKNAASAVGYVLSGGYPDAVRHLHDDQALAAPFDRLLDGALAFADGRRKEAQAAFAGIDETGLPPALAGHVALIKAVLQRNQDVKAAMRHIDRARLLMPATLVEEAALRRGVTTAGDDGDRERFLTYADDYLRRFERSVYLPDFQSKFAHVAVVVDLGAMPGAGEHIDRLVESLPPDGQRRFLLELGRVAVVTGDAVLARAGAERALSLSLPGSRDQLRARAYGAAADVVTERRAAAVAALNSLDLSRLDGSDRALVRSALGLAAEVTRLPAIEHSSGVPAKTGSDALDDGAPPEMPAVLARAQSLLGEVDSLIEEASQ